MTTIPLIRPSLSHTSSTQSRHYSNSPSPHLSSSRHSPHPLPLSRPSSVGGDFLPALDPSNPDPLSASSITSDEGAGPPTPSDLPHLFHSSADPGAKRRASTTSTGSGLRIVLQAIPPFVPRGSRQGSSAAPSSKSPIFPSVFEQPSGDAGMDIDGDDSRDEDERRGLGISVGSNSSQNGSKRRRVEEESDSDNAAPKQIKREPSTSPRLPSPSSTHSGHAQSLDTLASAASALSAHHSVAQLDPNLPHPPPSPIVLPLATPSDPRMASQLASALKVRTEQASEIQRRQNANSPPSASGRMDGLSDALEKLTGRPGPSASAAPYGDAGSGLAKRRGNVAKKNLTIVTPSYGPAHAGGVEAGLKSAPVKASTTSRMAPGVTPSVLAGPSIRGGGMATARPDFAGERQDGSTEYARGRMTVALPSVGAKVSERDARARQQQQVHAPTPSTSRRDPYPSVTQPMQTLRDQQRGEPTASKAAFLSLFSTFYDSLSDSRVLAHTLEDQIRRSSSLLHTLHESGKVFEDMLEKRVKEVVDDMSRDLLLNESRIVRLEKMVGVGPSKNDEREAGVVVDRLGRLEGLVEWLLEERERTHERGRGRDMEE